jgi:2,3-dihydroxybiphenyl 1,2-dioxygenase
MERVSVSELAYIELGVSDITSWHTYATEVLGLTVTTENECLLLKMDTACWRIKLVSSGEDDVCCAGFRVSDDVALQNITEQLSEIHIKVTEASASEAAARGVDKLVFCEDPSGLRIELFTGDRTTDESFTSSRQVSGFVTDDQGLGHIVLFVADDQAAADFYQKGLGFLLSDHITMGPEGRQIKLTFLHCNSRHHTIALVPVPLPKKLNHIMLQVNTIDDVGHGFDRATAHGSPISSSLGCHTNDKMISFYMKTPSGFDIEYGYGGVEIDDTTWETTTYDKPSIWGHKGDLN